MIPTIGFMVAAYTIVRLLEIATDTSPHAPNRLVQAAAVLAILVTGFCCFLLAGAGLTAQP